MYLIIFLLDIVLVETTSWFIYAGLTSVIVVIHRRFETGHKNRHTEGIIHSVIINLLPTNQSCVLYIELRCSAKLH